MRQTLWLSFSALLLLVIAAVLAASLAGTSRLAGQLAEPLLVSISRETATQLHRLFDPLRQKIAEDYASIQLGRFSTRDPLQLKDRFLPDLQSLSQVDSMMIGDLTGSQFLVMRYTPAAYRSALFAPVAAQLPPPAGDPNHLQFFTRDFRPTLDPENSRWSLWDDSGRTLVHSWELPLKGFDGRLRPWHRAAMAQFRDCTLDEAHALGPDLAAWTEVYTLFTTKAPGISASIAARDPAGTVLIVAYDLLLDEIARFSSAAHPTANGQIFVLTDDGRLLGPPCDPRPEHAARLTAAILQPAATCEYPAVTTAVSAWQSNRAARQTRFRLTIAGTTWWADFAPFAIGRGRNLWIGVLLPESDLVPAARDHQRLILAVGGFALILAGLLAAWLARRMSAPLTAVAAHARRLAALDLAPVPLIRTRVTELAQLSRTLNDTRATLHQHITERIQASEALRRSEIRYRTLIESALVGIVVHQDGIVRYVNPAVVQLFGYARADEVLGQAKWVDYIAPAYREELQARSAAALRGESAPLHPGWELVRRDGTRRWAQSSVTAIDWDGSTALLSFIRDITELRTATDRQAALEEQLRQAQKLEAVGLLAGGIAHDFNNLLQIIGGNASLAGDDTLPAPGRRAALAEIEKTVHRAAQMTRQLLAFGRRQALHREETELNQFASEHLGMVRRLIPENIQIEFLPAPRPIVVHADRGQLEQVFLNLCVNARDAMPEGGRLTLQLEALTLDAAAATHLGLPRGGAFTRITVSDTGQGMDKAILGRIFEPFFSTKVRAKGTGLGLAVVYGIVRQHEGHITASSQPGAGTSFVVHLPYLPDRAAPALPPPAPAVEPRATDGTILIAEDNEPIRRLAAQTLRQAGYTVLCVDNGQEAVERFTRDHDRIDLLFLDVMMPRLGGFAAARQCRALAPEIPVIFASGYAANTVNEEENIPADALLLQKPYRAEDMLRLVQRLLAKRSN